MQESSKSPQTFMIAARHHWEIRIEELVVLLCLMGTKNQFSSFLNDIHQLRSAICSSAQESLLILMRTDTPSAGRTHTHTHTPTYSSEAVLLRYPGGKRRISQHPLMMPPPPFVATLVVLIVFIDFIVLATTAAAIPVAPVTVPHGGRAFGFLAHRTEERSRSATAGGRSGGHPAAAAPRRRVEVKGSGRRRDDPRGHGRLLLLVVHGARLRLASDMMRS